MEKKEICISLSDDDEVDLMSALDRMGISLDEFDLRKLRIVYDEDWSGCYYPGEPATISFIISYDES